MEEKRGFLERGLTARAFIFGIILSIICAITGTATCYRGEYQYSSLINLAKIATCHEFDHIFLRIAYVALLPAFITALLPKGLRFSEAELVVIYLMIATVVSYVFYRNNGVSPIPLRAIHHSTNNEVVNYKGRRGQII